MNDVIHTEDETSQVAIVNFKIEENLPSTSSNFWPCDIHSVTHWQENISFNFAP